MNYKFFSFVLSPLSSIQKGIQTAHCAIRLQRETLFDADPESNEKKMLAVKDWAWNHETIIVLAAGASWDLEQVLSIIMENDFPFATFEESEEFLRGLRTCVGVLLPETVYKAKLDENGSAYVYHEYDGEGLYVKAHEYPEGSAIFDLLKIKNSKELAI